MIFKQTWQQVFDGTKTQTRRPIKPDEWRTYQGPDGVFYYLQDEPSYIPSVIKEYPVSLTGPDCRLKWQVGKDYAVQPGRGKKAVGRIRITKIRRERLQEITVADCLAEGIQERLGVFESLYYHVGHLTAFAMPEAAYRNLWDSLYRKPYCWEDNPEVWVLEFKLVQPGKET